MIVPFVDIYVTYRCNLRCSHCFVGDNLSLNSHFGFDDLSALIHTLHRWKTEGVTFLGGEPTLYPRIVEAVKLVQSLGMKARMVTNGLHGFANFMKRFDEPVKPFIGFSLDGSNAQVHDQVRGRGNFTKLMINIEHSRTLGYRSFGIVSVSRQNADDILAILDLCEEVGFEYVNVHYITDRGFATAEMVLPVEEWRQIYRRIEDHSRTLNVDLRVERTFVPQAEYTGSCAVRQQNNLMFFPDGRVFMCSMLIDLPSAHSFTWTRQGLVPNQAPRNERTICADEISARCPAMLYVNPTINQQAEQHLCAISCIYEKVRLRKGEVVQEV